MLRQERCVWTNPGQNGRQLYAIYEWKNLTEGGEEIARTFCYNDAADVAVPDFLKDVMIEDTASYTAFCESDAFAGKANLCDVVGCRWRGGNQKVCQAKNGKLNCKNLVASEEEGIEAEWLCAAYADCTWDADKGVCEGTFKID